MSQLTVEDTLRHVLPADTTQEEEDADKTSSVNSCDLFGSFISSCNEEKSNVSPSTAVIQVSHSKDIFEHVTGPEDNHLPEKDDTNSQSDNTNSQSDNTNSQSDNTNSQSDHTNSQSDDTKSQSDKTNSQSDSTNSQSDNINSQSDDTNSQPDNTNSQTDNTNSQSDDTKSQSDNTNSQSDNTNSQSDDSNSQSDNSNSQSDNVYEAFYSTCPQSPEPVGESKDCTAIKAGNESQDNVSVGRRTSSCKSGMIVLKSSQPQPNYQLHQNYQGRKEETLEDVHVHKLPLQQPGETIYIRASSPLAKTPARHVPMNNVVHPVNRLPMQQPGETICIRASLPLAKMPARHVPMNNVAHPVNTIPLLEDDPERFSSIDNNGDAKIMEIEDVVVQTVSEKEKNEPFNLEETKLTAEECDPIRLFLRNVSPITRPESMVSYLEDCCKAIPVEILFKRPGALVTFSTPPDVEKLLVMVKEKPLQGQYIQAARVSRTHQVLLSGLLPSITSDMIKCHFNTEHSGGGPITDVIFGTDKEICVVTFENVEDAEKVCMRSHKIDNKDIAVCLYYKCLDGDLGADKFPDLTHEEIDTEDEFRLPDPVEVKHLNPKILSFLVRNKKHKHFLEKSLFDINGITRWPSSGDNYLIIECLVKAMDKNIKVVFKDWNRQVVDKVQSIASGIELVDFFTVHEAWHTVVRELKTANDFNSEDVIISLEHAEYKITLAGTKVAVENLKKTVQDIIASAEKQSVTEIKVKTYEMHLLRESRFKKEIEDKYCGLSFTLNQKKMSAYFAGQSDLVQKAVAQMQDKLKSFVGARMHMSKVAKDLLLVKENTDYVIQKMKSHNVIGVLELDDKSEFQMFARDEREVQKAIQFVRDCIVEKEIKLDYVMVQNIHETQWPLLVQKIQEKHKQKVVIETKMMSVLITAVADIFQGVFDEVKTYLENYNAQGLFLALELVKVKFIQRYKMEDIKALEKQFENSHIKLSIIDCGVQKGINIIGTKDGCKSTKHELKKLVKSLRTKEHELDDNHGLRKFFESSSGKDELNSLELKFSCILIIKPEGRSKDSSSDSEDGKNEEPMARGGTSTDVEGKDVSVDQTLSTVQDGNRPCSSSNKEIALSTLDIHEALPTCKYSLSHSVVMEIAQGDITKETTDVIINSVLPSLDLSKGQVSNAILTAGGNSIQQEFIMKYLNLKDGFVVTNAGQLPCKMIIHVLVQDRRNRVEGMITRVLHHAEMLRFQSISFPAIGTGGRGLSEEMMAKAMYTAFKEFAKSEPKFLKKIRLVVFKEAMFNTIKCQVELRHNRKPRLEILKKVWSRDESIVFSITVDTESNFQAVIRELDGFTKKKLF